MFWSCSCRQLNQRPISRQLIILTYPYANLQKTNEDRECPENLQRAETMRKGTIIRGRPKNPMGIKKAPNEPRRPGENLNNLQVP